METAIIFVDRNVNKEETYTQAVDLLRNGEVVAFPTETVYGLGADASNSAAVAKIFEAKGRPSDNPLIVHVDSKESALKYVRNVSSKALLCMDKFWPGALTLVLDAVPGAFAPSVTAGLETVGVRVPNHPVALNLLKRCGFPLAAPSANTSGKPSPTLAEHVYRDMDERIPLILDGGATEIGLESTVLDLTTDVPVILRPGKVTKEQLEEVLGPVHLSAEAGSGAPKSPGMKYMHYAPDAPVYLIENNPSLIDKAIAYIHSQGKEVALLSAREVTEADYSFPLSAETLYRSLRQCDDTEVDLILAAVPSGEAALMNRLEKAADHKWFS